MNEVVKRDGRIWVNGVGPIGWGKDVECTYAGSLAAILKPTDRPIAYDEIMAASGLAFRVRWWKTDTTPSKRSWCPSTPVGEFPEELEWTQKHLGLNLDLIEAMANEKDPHMEQFAERIKKSIDAGKALCAYPNSEDFNLALLIGYTQDLQWMVRTYFKPDEIQLIPAEKLGPMAILLGPPAQERSHPEIAQDACRIAEELWTRRLGPQPDGSYFYGRAAIEAWQNDLAVFESLDETERKGLYFLNWWNFSQWADARQAAVCYLLKAAERVPSKSAKHLLKAADHYTAEVAILFGCYKTHDAFLGPWSGKSITDWDKATRNREIKVLEKAAALEDRAVKELKAAF